MVTNISLFSRVIQVKPGFGLPGLIKKLRKLLMSWVCRYYKSIAFAGEPLSGRVSEDEC